MPQVYYKLSHHKLLLFIGLVTACLTFLFISLQPHFASRFFPEHRAMVLNNFLKSVQQKGGVDARDFWQFREEYSPGNFQFNHNFADVAGVLHLQKVASPSATLLEFRSASLFSKDEVADKPFVLNFWPSMTQNQKQVLFSNSSTQIFYDQSNVLRIIFIKPISEMKTANGFFDYTGQEEKILHDFSWINETWVYSF